MEHFDEDLDELNARQQALEAKVDQIQKTLRSVDERLIVCTALGQAILLALTKQRKVQSEKLVDDFESMFHQILAQMGRRDLIQSVIVPPFPKKSFFP
jgi:hypothetical protein